MSSIITGIQLQDNFTTVLNNVVNAVNMTVSVMEQMQSTMNTPIDTAAFDGVRDCANQATIAVQNLIGAMENAGTQDMTSLALNWQSDSGIDVFNTSGIKRWKQEIQSANELMNQLASSQEQLTQQAIYGNILPPQAASDMITLNQRITDIQQRIQQISVNPMDVVSDTENAKLEQLRAQLNNAVQLQREMSEAVENMDVQAANQAYLRLSQTVSSTEQYIRDNVDEQGRVNREIQKGTDFAGRLKNTIAGVVREFVGVAGIKKAFAFVEDCTQAFDTQFNAETQLVSVLANILDGDNAAQLELETTVDTTGTVNEINDIQNGFDKVVVPISAESGALAAAFDGITEKASEIQSRGIYGDEAMIAGAAEFATYFSDTNAIEMMMDTLADYATGMSGGGEVGTEEMANYAANLGKIMSGSYDAMTEKGFELSDTQKAIIEGTATQEQIVSALGAEYANMSSDMQAAAAISQVIEGSWSGLYENMSNTPQGKIIQLKNAWGNVKETVGGQLYPAIVSIVDVVSENWGTIQAIIEGVTVGLSVVINALEIAAEAVFAVANFFVSNWSWIQPIIVGIATALAVYYGWILMVKAAQRAMAVATAIATTAQKLFNGTLKVNSAGVAAVGIGALVAALGLYTQGVNEAYGLSLSFAGMLGGTLMVVLAALAQPFIAIAKVALGVWETMKAVGENFYTFFWNMGVDIGTFCANFISSFLDVIAGVCEALNKLPFIDFDYSGITNTANEYAKKAASAGDLKQSYTDVGAAWERGWNSLDFIDLEEAWDAGYWLGEEIAGKLNTTSEGDYSAIDAINEMLNNTENVSENTDDIADTLEITEEDLKYLRDIAEQEAINRFTTAEITIEQTNHNTVSGKMDLDGVVEGLTGAVNEAVDMITEGVHA